MASVEDATAFSTVTLQSRRALYVGGIADPVTETTLRAAFLPFGPIKSVDMPRDYAKGTHRGFGFVEFESADDAEEAIFNMDGAEIMGKSITVNLAQPNQHKLGSSKPVWSSDEWFKEQAGNDEEKAAQKEAAMADEQTLKEKTPVSGS